MQFCHGDFVHIYLNLKRQTKTIFQDLLLPWMFLQSGLFVIFRKCSKNGSTPKFVSADPKNTGDSFPDVLHPYQDRCCRTISNSITNFFHQILKAEIFSDQICCIIIICFQMIVSFASFAPPVERLPQDISWCTLVYTPNFPLSARSASWSDMSRS